MMRIRPLLTAAFAFSMAVALTGVKTLIGMLK